jgi:hypothetical protein
MGALFGGVWAPSTLGSFLRSFTWVNVLQLGKVIPGKDLWTSRRTVSGKKATPAATIKITSVGSAQQNASA